MYTTKYIATTTSTDSISETVNGNKLEKDIQAQLEKFENKGITLMSITPIISGTYELETDNLSGGGAGYGFGFTSGVIIVGKK